MKKYGVDFYSTRHQKTLYSAKTILSVLLDRMPKVHSAVDIGCGVGTWLAVLKEMGVEKVCGFDGEWVDKKLLEIATEDFNQIDLSKPFQVKRKYDLAISLEVAEHLPSNRAVDFVSSLAKLSDYVLFSAAIPYQGGSNHINEEWQDYWIKLFENIGYIAHDFIRKTIWDDEKIPYWYKQNIILFSASSEKEKITHECHFDNLTMPFNIVHPELYISKAQEADSIRGSLSILKRALKKCVKGKLGKIF